MLRPIVACAGRSCKARLSALQIAPRPLGVRDGAQALIRRQCGSEQLGTLMGPRVGQPLAGLRRLEDDRNAVEGLGGSPQRRYPFVHLAVGDEAPTSCAVASPRVGSPAATRTSATVAWMAPGVASNTIGRSASLSARDWSPRRAT